MKTLKRIGQWLADIFDNLMEWDRQQEADYDRRAAAYHATAKERNREDDPLPPDNRPAYDVTWRSPVVFTRVG